MAAVSRVSVLYILGMQDSNEIEVSFLSPDPKRRKYLYVGNVHLMPLIDRNEFHVIELVCGDVPADEATVPNIDVIVNAVCDPDSNKQTLALVAGIQRQLGVPIVNRPERVLETTRDRLYQTLASLTGVTVPAAARITPHRRADVIPMAEDAGVRPPLIVREAGTHGGKGLTLVAASDATDELESFVFDGRDLYVTRYVDFRSSDGLYRKYRVLVVNGVPFPRHMIALPHWMIHSKDRPLLMNNRPDLQEEEQRFLSDFSPDRFPVFEALASTLGLDYFGVDFALGDDGDMIVFETNCCFRPIRDPQDPVYDGADVSRVKAAMGELIRARAGRTAPLPLER